MKTFFLLVFILLFAQGGNAQNTIHRNQFISTSIGVSLPVGEFGSVDWFNNNSVGLACTGLNLNVISFGKYIRPNLGFAFGLNAGINPINHSSNQGKKPFWKTASLGVGGLYRIPKNQWELNVEAWANYLIMLGVSDDFYIKEYVIPNFNALYGGVLAEIKLGTTYHLSSKLSIKGMLSNRFSIGKFNYGILKNDKKKGFGMVDMNLGVVYWY